MDTFGCCSSYVECSDKRQCIHADDPEYAGCQYRKNLESGRIFYGCNAGKNTEAKKELPTAAIPVLNPEGRTVIAVDEYWGTYKGVIVGTYDKAMSSEKMAWVKILEMLKYPRQNAILYKNVRHDREPYPVGSVHNFDMQAVSFVEETEEKEEGDKSQMHNPYYSNIHQHNMFFIFFFDL